MFFSETELSLEFLGIFKINRNKSEQKNLALRGYDSLSIRLDGIGIFNTESGTVKVSPGDVLYIPKNARFSQSTEGETILAIHFSALVSSFVLCDFSCRFVSFLFLLWVIQ